MSGNTLPTPALDVPPPNPRGKLVVWVTLWAGNLGDLNNGIAIAAALHAKVIKVVDVPGSNIREGNSSCNPDGAPEFMFIDPVTQQHVYERITANNMPDVVIDTSSHDYTNTIMNEPLLRNALRVKVNMPDVPGITVGNEEADLGIYFSHHLKEGETLPGNTKKYDLAPTRITPTAVHKAAENAGAEYDKFRNRHPVYTLIIGERVDKDPILAMQDMENLAQKMAGIIKETGGSLLVTTSNRTFQTSTDSLRAALDKYLLPETPRKIFDFKNPDCPNPYKIMLGMADKIILMSDSMSMLSDAIATGKDVLITKPLPPAKEIKRDIHQIYCESAISKQLARPIAEIAQPVPTKPLETYNSAYQMAKDIRQEIAKKEPTVIDKLKNGWVALTEKIQEGMQNYKHVPSALR